MGILLKSVKSLRNMNKSDPREVKRQIVLEELKALNVTVARSGESIEKLDYEALKEEWVIASILSIDIETPANKFF